MTSYFNRFAIWLFADSRARSACPDFLRKGPLILMTRMWSIARWALS